MKEKKIPVGNITTKRLIDILQANQKPSRVSKDADASALGQRKLVEA